MNKKNIAFLSLFALLGSLTVLVQTVAILISGEVLCLNGGCRITENLISLRPIYMNLAGFGYFQAVFWFGLLSRKRVWAVSFMPVLLLAGLGAEGVLIGFQTFVAHSFCSYCILIFVLIALMNACLGLRHFFAACVIFTMEFFLFSVLKFDINRFQKKVGLDSGTYAVRQCNDPKKRLYLIFSEDCPHCKAVLDVLKTCSACEVHFNPVSRPKAGTLPGVEPFPDYNPDANRSILKLLGIYTVPVLIVENRDGLNFIRGQDSIINYIKEQCVAHEGAGIEFEPANPFSQQGVCSFDEPCK